MLRITSPRRVALLALIAVAAIPLLTPESADARFWYRQPKPTANLIETLENDGRFGTLLFAIEEAGLTETIETADALTVFAPTDEAFGALPPELVQALLDDIPSLKKVLFYHVLGGSQRASTLARSTVATTLQGQPVVAIRDDGGLRVNGIPVEDANVRATNGIAHVIGEVLIPAEEDFEVETLVDVLALDGRFNTLIDLVVHAGLAETLTSEGPFTVFAPIDDAFAELGQDTLDALKEDIPALQNILTYHVIGDRRSAFSLVIEGGATTVQGSAVDVDLHRGVMVDDAELLGFDAKAPNGLVHVIDGVLTPEETDANALLEALADAGYTTLVAAIEAAGLGEALGGLGPVTILAPTNEAFAALGSETLNALLDDPDTLANILLYHVIQGETSAFSLVLDRSTPTVQGASVKTRFRWFRGVFINDAKVIDFDRELPGATVQGIDEVLIPPAD